MPTTRMTIYLDAIDFEDDDGTVRATISDRKGNEVEVIACPPRFVGALKGAQKFWGEFTGKRARAEAEAYIASLPKGKLQKA